MADSTEDILSSSSSVLSDLCSICHVQPPKYRCPRCSTRTCSLPCSRRHKLWSECSGIRDPAAYLRRSELATESAFDRDFNFITSIERKLERAERDVENRGMTLDRDAMDGGDDAQDPLNGSPHGGRNNNINSKKRKRGTKPTDGLAKGELAFLRGVEKAGVRLVRAPKGMSRRKQNMSRWLPRSKCLNWTVEWILPNGDKTTRSYPETVSIAAAFDRVVPPSASDPETTTPLTRKVEYVPPLQEGKQQDNPNAQDASPLQPHPPAESETRPLPTPHRGVYFYLHRPQTATKHPILIPLSPTLTLSESLRSRTVLEFPTIYVLTQSPERIKSGRRREEGEAGEAGMHNEDVGDDVSIARPRSDAGPKTFLLEEEYLLEQKIVEGESRMSAVGTTGIDEEDMTSSDGDSETDSSDSSELEDVDEGKILEVLKQDLSET